MLTHFRLIGRARPWLIGAATCGVLLHSEAFAQGVAVQPGERLSAWLLRQPASSDAEPLGLSWRSQAEVPIQIARKTALAQALQASAPELARFVADMPATGRVRLPNTDPRWLQTNPAADPLLQPGDTVLLPRRSEWVAVVGTNGLLCLTRYEPSTASASYLAACGQHLDRATAWLVQPDGQVFRQGLQRWNEHAQLPPAPGAWLWAPVDGSLPETLSDDLARFLSTQGPAPGAAANAILERHQLDRPLSADTLRDLPTTTNDWGVTGLWQTPTARLGQAGQANFTFSRNSDYANLAVQLQPFEWLSGAFRYTDVNYQRYGAQALSGDQSYKDKSVDLKLRLWEESTWIPQAAVGWRDLLGTGIFSGEYVVASKRAGNFDVSLGMGWGYVGKRGDISNPLGRLSDRFNQRPNSSNPTGGKFNAKAYFRGPAALFGGVQYHTPWDNWVIKAEYEGNDYQHEPFNTALPARTAVNVGVVWRAQPWLDLSLAYERGNTLLFALSARSQLDGLHTPKLLDAPAVRVHPGRPKQPAPPQQTARDIEAQTNLTITSIERQGSAWVAVASNPYLGYAAPMIDRSLAVLHRDAPADADQLALRFEQRGTQIGQVRVDRDTWANTKNQLLPESQRPASPRLAATQASEATPVQDTGAGPFSYGFGLSYRQSLGGPDAFVLYQLAADARAEWRLSSNTWLAGTYRLALLDNYERFKYTAPSNLPRVRTLVREYATASRGTLPALQLTHMGQLGQNHFYLAYGGLLESMYAGVGVEYLYRPVNSRLAVGFDANAVRQRDFNQHFGLRDYRVNTGHANLYWDTGFSDLLLKASAGRYLAGDRGITLDLSKVFHNGVAIGAYATKTNVSAAQFGEGSFDKGIYLQIPFDALLPKSGPSSATIRYSPLIRDGGARLGKRYTLYELTSLRDSRAMSTGPLP